MRKFQFSSSGKAAVAAAFFLLCMLSFPFTSVDVSGARLSQSKIKAGKNKMTVSTSTYPDFAFPETVSKEAANRLDEALVKGDGEGALSSALNLTLARNEISSSSFVENVRMLDSIAGVLPAPYSSIAYLLEANLYRALYESDRWKFNQRVLPADVYPEDPLSWSTPLFAERVLELVTKANSNVEIARVTPLKDISSLISDSEYALEAGMAVEDFIVSNSVAQLTPFAGVSTSVIPFFGNTMSLASTPAEKCSVMINDLTESLFVWREESGNKAALTAAVLQRCRLMKGEKGRDFLEEQTVRLLHDPSAALLLNELRNRSFEEVREDDGKKDIYALMQTWIGEFPSAPYSPIIKRDLSEMSRKRALIKVPDTCLPDVPVKATVTSENMNTAYLLLYSVPESAVPMNSLNVKMFPGSAKLVTSIKATFEGVIPFSGNKEVDLPPLAKGYYVVLPSSSSRLSKNWKKELKGYQIGVINVTDIDLMTSFSSVEKGTGKVYVTDAVNQRPIAGASVTFYSDDQKKTLKKATTDETGSVDAPEGFMRVRASNDGSVVWQMSDIYTHAVSKPNSFHVNILTDLSVYRPGEKVGFVAVAWKEEGRMRSLLRDEKLKVVMNDANFNPLDTLLLTTDKAGRCSGYFDIPTSGLLGNFSLQASLADNKNSRFVIGSQRFQVAEYKSPTFFVDVRSVADTVPASGGALRFSGEALTYSGVSAGVDKVSYTVDWQQWWRYLNRGVTNATFGSTVVVDPSGHFEIELPTKDLEGSEFETGVFTLTVTATNAAGETQSSSPLRFSLDKDGEISPEIPGLMEVATDTVSFNVPVRDIMGNPVIRSVNYSVVNTEDGRRVAGGSFSSPVLRLPARILSSAEYRLEFSLPDDTVKVSSTVALWRRRDEEPPMKTPLWVPVTQVTVKKGEETVPVTIGSSYSDSWIFCQIADEAGHLERKWLPVSGRNRKVELPAGEGQCWITLSGMRDLDRKTATVVLIPEEYKRKMEAEVVTFRDKLTAGSGEKWTFRFKTDGIPVQDVAAMAVMSNKALNAVEPFSWNLYVNGYQDVNYARFNYTNTRSRTVGGYFSPLLPFMSSPTIYPDWDTKGLSFAGGGNRIYVRGTMRKAMATNSVVTEQVVDESKDEEAVFYSAASVMAYATADMGAAKMEDAVAVAESDDAEMASTGNGEGGGATDQQQVRPVDLPLAFFMPDLTGDQDGNVEVSFTVPDFNTTWQFQMVGYDDSLLTASTTLDAVAAKPVMVKSNPPRYLRTGDKATVMATVFNNTDRVLSLGGRMVVADPTNGRVIASGNLAPVNTDPGASRTMMVSFDVPSDLSSLSVISYASSEGNSDGERALVAVLPSSMPVVESTTFYMGSAVTTRSLHIPRLKKGANVALKYCADPVWECLLALPSVSVPESDNVLAVSRSLFANCMASSIVKKYPSVRSGLEDLFKGDTLSISSSLSCDEELKTVALNSTPWVNNAAAETMRMRRLSTLLDDKTVDAAKEKLMKGLSSLQKDDGGWSWCKGMTSSLFMTERVLSNLAMLKHYDALPADGGMTRKAIVFADKTILDNYEKSGKKLSTTEMAGYLYDRQLLGGGAGKNGFSRLMEEVLKAVEREWKDMSVYEKATSALLLNSTKRSPQTVKEILESLRQLALKDVNKGWCYDNLISGYNGFDRISVTARALEAFSIIEPGGEAEEGLRQWLLLQKETEDWGAYSYTSGVIAAIMASGGDPAVSALPVVTINGKPLKFPESSSISASAVVSLDPSAVSGKELKITKGDISPMWGGIISQYIAPATEIKRVDCDNLSIEKRIVVVETGAKGKVAKEGKLKVGDKVRVTLTITCGKDMDYVAVIDERAACLEPDDQISGYTFTDGLGMYREVRDSRTSFFIGFLPKGVNVISYDCTVDRPGTYTSGMASAQSQYAPQQTAHSAAPLLTITE